MKNKILIATILILILSTFFPSPVKANAPLPPAFTIVVINPPTDLELSVQLTKNEVNEIIPLEKVTNTWEAKFTLWGIDYWSEQENYKNAILIVKSKDYTFEIPLGDSLVEIYYSFYILDLETQTLLDDYPAWRAPVSAIMRVILTLLIEGIVFFLFAYREKRSWIVFLIVNLVTQGILHVWITVLGYSNYGILFLWIGEMIVLIVEIVVYLFALKEHKKPRAVGFAFLANFLSLILGTVLYHLLPF